MRSGQWGYSVALSAGEVRWRSGEGGDAWLVLVRGVEGKNVWWVLVMMMRVV